MDTQLKDKANGVRIIYTHELLIFRTNIESEEKGESVGRRRICRPGDNHGI